MADGHDVDRPPDFLDSVDDDVLADDEPAEIWVDPFGEETSQSGLVGEISDALAEILDDPSGSRGILLGDKVQKFDNPFQGGIGPEDPVGH